jgi:hypothetical protein
MRNNIIAIIAISFVTVGALWGIGNLLNPAPEVSNTKVEGMLLIAQRSSFNDTNPDVLVAVNVPVKLVMRNDDAITHDITVDKAENNGITPFSTGPILGGFTSQPEAIVTEKPGTYEYYCSIHPNIRGKIIAQ